MATPLVHDGVVANHLSASSATECRCDELADRVGSQSYSIAPARGGGWAAWTTAFARLLTRLVLEPTHCLVVTQEPNQRYVQMLLGHGHAHVEASGNRYLTGDHRLDATEERLLQSLGFRPAGELPPESTGPYNWWFDVDVADPVAIADVLTVAIRSVMRFDQRYPITIEVFGAAAVCEFCFWE